jgi:tetratricopeptide (TPR) repeat protein
MCMPSAARATSAAVGRLLRRHRKNLKLTLVEVSERLGKSGDRIPPSTLARIEQGKLDPGIVRLNKLLSLYRIRPHLVSDLMDLEEVAVEPPIGKDVKSLFNDGLKHWQEGNLPQALAHLFAVRELVPTNLESRILQQKAILAFAVFARDLGRFELAHQLVEDLLRERPEPSILVNILVLGASVWRGLGSMEAALAFQARAELHLDLRDHRQVAWVYHQKGKLLTLAGEPAQAKEALARAVEAYRAAGDSYGESKALLTTVGTLAVARRFPEALGFARDVLAQSLDRGHTQVELIARIEIGRILVATGRTDEGIEMLSEALGKAVLLKEKHGQFLVHYWLWKAYGDAARARLELESARYFVRFTNEVCPEAEELRRIEEEGAGGAGS